MYIQMKHNPQMELVSNVPTHIAFALTKLFPQTQRKPRANGVLEHDDNLIRSKGIHMGNPHNLKRSLELDIQGHYI